MKAILTIFLFNMFFFVSCTGTKKYEPMIISKDACFHCKMLITDSRFGAEIVTEKGKVYKFDSIECLGNYLEENKGMKGTIYVVDSFKPQEMLEFKVAQFIHDPNIRSPMGKGIFAGTSDEINSHNSKEMREVLKWEEVLKLIGKPELNSRF